MAKNISTIVLQIVQKDGPLTSKEILACLERNYSITSDKETVNSLLYGELHSFVIRDKDERGYPTWRAKSVSFEAAKGLEVMFYKELLKRRIVTRENTSLDYEVRNRRNKRTYHLDLAIFHNEKKFNIEIDGYEHMRADARLSIQKQLEKYGSRTEIEIDWMDNRLSYTDFSQIDMKSVFQWCSTHQEWCIRYHEELLKPHDITRNIWLIESGWRIIRFWNFELKEQMERCIRDVKDWLED